LREGEHHPFAPRTVPVPFWMLDDSTEANGATLMVPWLAHALASARRRGVRLGRRRRIRLLSPLSVSRSTH